MVSPRLFLSCLNHGGLGKLKKALEGCFLESSLAAVVGLEVAKTVLVKASLLFRERFGSGKDLEVARPVLVRAASGGKGGWLFDCLVRWLRTSPSSAGTGLPDV